MTPRDQFPLPEPGIDALVRAQLDAEASRVDPAAVSARVFARLETDVPSSHRGSTRRRLGVVAGFMALAVALLVGVFVLGPSREAVATPVQVVESARAAYVPDADRCYSQTLQLPTNTPAPLALVLDSGRTVSLCTRGDRFVVEPGLGGRGAWGSDGKGRVWIAPTRDAAARFDETELPPAVRDVVRIRGLEIGTLLDEVLKDYDLAWAEEPVREAPTFAVVATRRNAPIPGQIRSADLVVEKDTRMIRSLVLKRQLISGDIATVTFTLTVATARDARAYTAEGHIDAGRPVFDSTRPILRRKILLQNLGDVLVNGL